MGLPEALLTLPQAFMTQASLEAMTATASTPFDFRVSIFSM